MGIFSFFQKKAEITIKFDHELEGFERESVRIPPIIERIFNKQPANPSLTSEATGRVFFTPELLGLSKKTKDLNRINLNEEDVIGESIPIYHDGDSLKGNVYVKVLSDEIKHYGIKIDFFGVLDFPGGLRESTTFCHLSSNLAAEGRLKAAEIAELPFEFRRVELPHESYQGRHLQIKYFIRVGIKRGLGSDLIGQRGVWVRDYTPPPLIQDCEEDKEALEGWQLEVGLEDQLHINFSSPKHHYALEDCIEGELHFSLVNLKIKSADLSLVRREIVGNHITDQEVLQRYQIIDGSPERHDCVPFKLPLKNLRDLTPSLRDIEKIGSLLYFVNLIIYDIEGRRYFKQQEVKLYRNRESKDTSLSEKGFLHQHLLAI